MDIQSLVDEIQRLNDSIDSWNDWVIIAMTVTAVAGSVLVVAQVKVNKESRKLASVQNLLANAKDEKLANDLRDKDVLIAAANERSNKLELDAEIQRKLTAEANKRAVEAKLDLEKYRAPRMLKPAQEEAFVAAISGFKGQRVFVGAIADTAEASSLGVQLYLAFGRAGLNVEGRGPYVKRVVRVARGVVVKHVTGNDKALRLAIAISKSLNDSGIMATRMGSLDEEVVERMEKEQGMSRNHENWDHVAVAIGDKP